MWHCQFSVFSWLHQLAKCLFAALVNLCHWCKMKDSDKKTISDMLHVRLSIEKKKKTCQVYDKHVERSIFTREKRPIGKCIHITFCMLNVDSF